MLVELNAFYKSNGISAIDFHCPHFEECSRFSRDTFTTAKEAFVSTGYVAHIQPRILFLSLDSGSADRDPKRKTIEFIRQHEEYEEDVLRLPKNKHWYRTHELAFRILRHFDKSLKIEDAKKYFAHINSAKCCMNNPGRAQANSILFENCRGFIPSEIEILAPDVIITQGAWAKQAILNAFQYMDIKIDSPDSDKLPEEIQLIRITKRPVIWIHTFHPRNPNSKRNRDNYQIYEKFIYEFITKKTVEIENYNHRDKPSNRNTGGIHMDPKPNIEKLSGYIYLEKIPVTPAQSTPSKEQSRMYEYMTMVQLCNIAEAHGMTRSMACNAFGGDKGLKEVEPARMARVILIGNKLRKFVLVNAVIDYYQREGIQW
ncbi:MAG: hypothetical protein FD147_1888 [Chloroflexi bacterium]|nr:MAG: hypothetical protein FD147_1888 [Chloroflexota bacterium]